MTQSRRVLGVYETYRFFCLILPLLTALCVASVVCRLLITICCTVWTMLKTQAASAPCRRINWHKLPLPTSIGHSSVRQQRYAAAWSAKTDSSAPTEQQPQSAATSSRQQQQSEQQPSNPQVECVATGMDVQCYISDDESSTQSQQQMSQQPQPALAGLPSNGNGQVPEGQHIDCVSTGMDVQCFITDDDETTAAPKVGGSAAPAPPRTAAAAAASGEGGPLMQLLGAALLVSPFFFWGTSMVAMKPVTAHTTPLLLGAMRLLPAGLTLVAWAAATGRPQPKTATAWAWVLAFAIVDGAAFQGFLAEGLQRTSAGLGSVIIDSQPLSVALLAALLFGEALSPLGVSGLFIGVAGLLLLELPQEVLAQSTAAVQAGGLPAGLGALQEGIVGAAAAAGGEGWSLTSSGEFWMLLAAQSMAVGTVMVRWVSKHCDPVAATAWHMVLGGIILAVAAVAADGDSGELVSRLSQFNSSDALAMAYVSLFGGAASYGIFFYEATHGSLTAISSLTFLTPVFAAGAGYLLLGETLTSVQLIGATVTLSAVFAINTPASHTDSSTAKKEA